MRSNTKSRPRHVTLRTVGERAPVRRPEAVPVIVELAGDGWVTVYGPRHVRAVIVNRFDDDAPAAVSADMATLADLFHELELPRSHRVYYWPVHVLAVGLVRRRTPEGDARRNDLLWIIRELAKLRAELAEGQKGRAAV